MTTWVRAELGFFNVDFENIIPRLPPRSVRVAWVPRVAQFKGQTPLRGLVQSSKR